MLILVFLTTVFVDLLTAVGIGMVVACVLFMKRAGDLAESQYSSISLADFDKEKPWEDEVTLTDEMRKTIYVQRLEGPIFFGSITGFQKVMHDVPNGVNTVIIRMRLVTFMDQSGAYAMETAIKDLQARNINVYMTIIQPQPSLIMHKTHLIPSVLPEESTFDTFEACVEHLKNKA